jgi:TetR/AcrR family transcriptional regulator, transcriptional repressor for nem operon
MRRETRRGAETRTRMLQTATKLFHHQGLYAISVDDILEQSRTGKSQFYYYFKNKEGLVHAVLFDFYTRLRNNQAPIKTKIQSWQDLEEWFGFFLKFQQQSRCELSCPVGTIGNDVTSDQELLRQDVRLILDLMNRSLVDFFTLMKGKKRLSPKADPQALADFCLCIMEGGLLLGKIRRETEPFRNSIIHAMKYLKSIARL